MRHVSRAALTTAVAAALASTAVIATSSSASAAGCPSGEEMTNWGCAVVTYAPNAISSAPAPGTGGLILRDENGRDLGSGIGEKQAFEFIKCGPSGSGLIYVNQLTYGNGGGWGDLYKGYVKSQYTKTPGAFDCN